MKCECGGDASFYCGCKRIFLCQQHKDAHKDEHKDHNVEELTSNIGRNEFPKLQKKLNKRMGLIQGLKSELIDFFNELISKIQKKMEESIKELDELVELYGILLSTETVSTTLKNECQKIVKSSLSIKNLKNFSFSIQSKLDSELNEKFFEVIEDYDINQVRNKNNVIEDVRPRKEEKEEDPFDEKVDEEVKEVMRNDVPAPNYIQPIHEFIPIEKRKEKKKPKEKPQNNEKSELDKKKDRMTSLNINNYNYLFGIRNFKIIDIKISADDKISFVCKCYAGKNN